MDQARHVDARHAPDKSQQPVRRPPANPQRKNICGLAGENTHEAAVRIVALTRRLSVPIEYLTDYNVHPLEVISR